MLRYALIALLSLCVFTPFPAIAIDIATCGESSGYSYDAFRRLQNDKEIGWKKDKITNGQFTLKLDEQGHIDLLISSAAGVSSSLSDGAKIFPATISDEAVTIVVLYPNQLVETYVFQKLKNGKFQAMWTQAKAETPIPRITAFVSDCSYLNLDIIKSQ